jgi:Protein of unknown function (DUF551)
MDTNFMSQWILIEDKLPEIKKNVLLINDRRTDGPYIGFMDIRENYIWENRWGDIDLSEHKEFWVINDEPACAINAFTHWMPLPEPPAISDKGD